MNTPEKTNPVPNTGFDIRRVYEETSRLEEDALWTLREVDFVTHFLPIFSGEVEDDQKLGDWTRMAGGPGRCVRVVDLQNKTLFLVPPLQLPAVINSNSPTLKGVHVYDILDNFKRIAMAKAAGMARTYLENSLDNYAEQVRTNPDLAKYQTQWEEIFKRYGIEPKFPNGESAMKKEDDAPVVGFDPL